MKILTVVHWVDLFQLALQAESLSKFWLGKKRWTIIIEDSIPSLQELSLQWCRQNIKIDGWEIDFIVPNLQENYYNGWIRQQQFKLYYSSIAEEEWILILDAKNFMIRPTDESFFFKDNGIVYLPSPNTEFCQVTFADAKKILEVDDINIPLISSITPWIFNKTEVINLINKTGISLTYWPMPTQATEFTLYWVWTHQKFNWIPLQFISGFWQEKYSKTVICNPSMTDIKDGASTIDDIRFWTHHRYTADPLARKITTDLLKEIGISNKSLKRWNSRFQTILNSQNVKIHQEFLKNRQGTSPEFNIQWYNNISI